MMRLFPGPIMYIFPLSRFTNHFLLFVLYVGMGPPQGMGFRRAWALVLLPLVHPPFWGLAFTILTEGWVMHFLSQNFLDTGKPPEIQIAC